MRQNVMTPGGDWAFFPTAARGRLSFVGTHADINLWSIAIDAGTGKAHGPLRRLTRGAGFISHLTLSEDGRSLAYFAARHERRRAARERSGERLRHGDRRGRRTRVSRDLAERGADGV